MTDPTEGGPQPESRSSDPLTAMVRRARAAAERRDWPLAIEAGQFAVELVRKAGGSREAQETLGVMLFNLAGYYAEAERFDESVRALEEVVALDERLGHADLEKDRQALEQARMMASLSPEKRAELRQQAEEMAERLEGMSPEDRAALAAEARQAQISHMVQSVQEQALAVLRDEREVGQSVEYLRQAAEQAAGDEHLGDARGDLAAYFAAVAAVLSGESPPSVPPAYAAQIEELRDARA